VVRSRGKTWIFFVHSKKSFTFAVKFYIKMVAGLSAKT